MNTRGKEQFLDIWSTDQAFGCHVIVVDSNRIQQIQGAPEVVDFALCNLRMVALKFHRPLASTIIRSVA